MRLLEIRDLLVKLDDVLLFPLRLFLEERRRLLVRLDGRRVERAEELKPDLILLDIGLPSLNGIEAAKRISTLVPDAMIIFVTQHNDAQVVAKALSNGAKAYLLKADAYRELLPAVDAVLEGKRFISSGVLPRP